MHRRACKTGVRVTLENTLANIRAGRAPSFPTLAAESSRRFRRQSCDLPRWDESGPADLTPVCPPRLPVETARARRYLLSPGPEKSFETRLCIRRPYWAAFAWRQ